MYVAYAYVCLGSKRKKEERHIETSSHCIRQTGKASRKAAMLTKRKKSIKDFSFLLWMQGGELKKVKETRQPSVHSAATAFIPSCPPLLGLT